jgi:hypothetical protein
MSKYELSDAVSLFSQFTAIINNLWTVYVAATFTAAGFGISSSLHVSVSIAVTIGFWAFTLGHLHLLRQALAVSKTLGNEISSALASETDGVGTQFQASIRVLANAVNPTRAPIAIHLLIDVCVTIALWARVPQVTELARKIFG